MPEADKRCFVRRKVHIIDYYENASERLPHYARVLQGPNFKTQSSPTRTPLAKRSKPSVGLTVPVCPHCGSVEQFASVAGEKHPPGQHYCNGCQGQLTVTVGTVFERSKIPLTKWWLATYLLSSSKKGMSSHQLHRMLGVTYKTAWFMSHRIREAMRDGAIPGGMGGCPRVFCHDR